jgi:hypothetical protein
MALHHRQRDRGQYSFGVGKTTQRKSKAHTPRYTQSVFSMHWYRMRERWASLAARAEFHEGIRTWPDGRIRKLLRIGLPIIQAGSNDRADYRQSLSGGVPRGLSYPRNCPNGQHSLTLTLFEIAMQTFRPKENFEERAGTIRKNAYEEGLPSNSLRILLDTIS